ncbi:hypothetical protein BO82DRAFT_133814 [Aspergillus uvarum CBS 121591]|uniref:Uncharacterized protein n=1 Tax=Aspergillus uvarum CBS 121591 TaxID=1448315 RepID=A0A319C2Z0_9EURO|nr:hypothetical protein BO82DRAFT_133814 [Aspergillus uvarum CBS 121591]PYH79485.1 hypothetical protein BO82DRAFT_133814 [Aspergillus uvarum CBS 121591]
MKKRKSSDRGAPPTRGIYVACGSRARARHPALANRQAVRHTSLWPCMFCLYLIFSRCSKQQSRPACVAKTLLYVQELRNRIQKTVKRKSSNVHAIQFLPSEHSPDSKLPCSIVMLRRNVLLVLRYLYHNREW